MPLFWSPDTCVDVELKLGCRLGYVAVGGVKSNVPANYDSTDRTCTGHTGLVGVALAAVLLDESQRRQIAFTIAKGLDADLQPQVGDDEERVIGTYSGQDADRVLEITFNVVVTGGTRGQMRDAFDLQFGPGKVAVPNA